MTPFACEEEIAQDGKENDAVGKVVDVSSTHLEKEFREEIGETTRDDEGCQKGDEN